SFRDFQKRIAPFFAKALRAHPVATVFGLPFRLIQVRAQVARVLIAQQDHVTALGAISAIGTSTRYAFLAPKAHATASAISGFLPHHHCVKKRHSATLAHNLTSGEVVRRLAQALKARWVHVSADVCIATISAFMSLAVLLATLLELLPAIRTLGSCDSSRA